MTQRLLLLFFCLSALPLAGCVTTVEGSKVDKVKMVESQVKLGMAYLQQDKRDNALRAFTAALAVNKKAPKAHQGMALIHHMNGEMEAAEASFKRALSSRSSDARSDIEYSYGRFLADRGNCKEAIPYYERASKDITYFRRVKAIFNLGSCAGKLGDEARAVASYQHAFNLNSNYSPAAIELAHKRFSEGNYAEAKRFLDVYSRNARQSSRSLWLGIRIERIFGNKDKEASYALALKNLHPYSLEYLEYKNLLESEK